jgi:glutaredoxin
MVDFTHDVIAEYVTTTTCPYCPTASSQLYSIYQSNDYPFHYVSFVADANNKIYSRVQELGVSGVPVVFFDGKYSSLTGAQPDETTYRNRIETAGARILPDIDISLTVKWQGPALLKISVTVTNNEPEEYNGHLRVYIMEKESRWLDANNQPFHNGLLYIPIDKALAIPKNNPMARSDTYSFNRLWIGSLYGFGDITEDNTLVLAAIFDQNTDQAVECTSATPTIDSSTTPLYANRPLFYLLNLIWERAYLFL